MCVKRGKGGAAVCIIPSNDLEIHSAIILDYSSEVIVDDVSYGAWVILQTADHCLMMSTKMTNDVRNQLQFSSGFIGATPKW